MEQITNNEQLKDNNEQTPTLFQVYKKLGERNRAAKKVVERMAEKGTVVALNTVYNVIYGRSSRADITEEFLNVAAEMLAQAKDLQARAAALAAS
jgi:hypothetical protein